MKQGTAQEASVNGQEAVAFTADDVALFSEASGDRNPLHLDRTYAQRTPYGHPVIFGCLGAMACLGHLQIPARAGFESITADFLRPLFSGVQYQVKTRAKDGVWEARLFDGSILTTLVRATVAADSGLPMGIAGELPGVFSRLEANSLPAPEIKRGTSVAGSYRCNETALRSLAKRWGIENYRLTSALCWTSYMVGMELPGESALFFRLALALHKLGIGGHSPLDYTASVSYAGFGQIKIEVALKSGGLPFASGQCWSYVRPPVPVIEEADSAGIAPNSMAGKVAVVTGVSRGLGAAIARALERRGAIVYGIARSEGGARTEVGDAADPAVLRRLKERILSEQGRIDYLICNASPPLLPLVMEPNGAERIAAFIGSAVALTLSPLCELADLLGHGYPCTVIISSVAAETPVKEWPHYVAAKRASEALGAVAVLQYPNLRTLIVRPDKLITNLTNTPMGHVGAASPKLIAGRIAERLENPPAPGKVEVLY